MSTRETKSIPKRLVHAFRNVRASLPREAIFVVASREREQRGDIQRKIDFYFEGQGDLVRFTSRQSIASLFSRGPILTFLDKDDRLPAWYRVHDGVFDVNATTNSMEAWRWFDAEIYLNGRPDREAARRRYAAWKDRVLSEGLAASYIFGTGPSLEKAIERDWSDGIRLVCNTIVRDPELWHKIDPHAVVAADALYHFGYTEFARAFRADLLARLTESPDTVFIYPEIFQSRVARDFPIDPDRLIPIETGQSILIHDSIASEFRVPALGNVLNKMLLPIACDLSKEVKLWGFDGRAPSDKLFWANSNKHTYLELMPTLQAAHPAFFDHFVPKADPESYVRSVHGEVLEYCLSEAEKRGWTFEMLHPSWTETLNKRLSKA